jgi:ABC-2 type transport system ATP-binding protein
MEIDQIKEVIAVSALSKYFGELCAVDQVSLKVNKSDIFGFLGPNGSGKTTTIRMLCGLLTPDSGEGHCLGYDIVKESAAIKKHVGYMPQYFSLYKDLSILENLRFVAKLYDVPNAAQRIAEVMDDFALTKRQSQLAANLSGGWKQKLTLAACLVHNPRLLLLDEPTAGIDPRSRRDFWDIIYDLSKDGLTTLVTTHYMDEAQRCNKLAYISFSKLLIEGTEEDIIRSLNLTTFLITGEVQAIAAELRDIAGIDVVAFGRSLHVSSTDKKRLTAILQSYHAYPHIHIREIPASIEDAFVYMVGEQHA